MKQAILLKRFAFVAALLICVFAAFTVAPLFVSKAQNEPVQRAAFEDFVGADEATTAIRDKEFSTIRIDTPDEAARARAAATGVVVADYGTSVVVAAQGPIDGAAQKIDTRIHLPGRVIEPLATPDKSTAGDTLAVPGASREYYIVQFAAPAKGEWLESIEDAGAEIVQYVPSQAFFVYADAGTAGRLMEHSRVRWVGKYEPEMKVPQHTAEASESVSGDSRTYDVAVFSRGDFAESYNRIAGIAGGGIKSVEVPSRGFLRIITVDLDQAQMQEVAALREVFRIDPFVEPVPEDERAAHIVAGNYTDRMTIALPGYDPLTQFGVDGSGVTVSISDDGVSIPGDGGFYITSANTVDGPLRGATAGAEGGHGHINASIVAGSTPFGGLDPTGYNYGRGVAPGAHIINIPFLKTGNTTTDSQSVDDTVSTNGPNGVAGSIINNSWGAGTNGNAYDSRAALWDSFVFDASTGAGTHPINLSFRREIPEQAASPGRRWRRT